MPASVVYLSPMPSPLCRVSLLFVKRSRPGLGKVNVSSLVIIAVQVSWRGSAVLSHRHVLLVWLKAVDTAPRYNVQILAKDKQNHFAIHMKAKSWSLDAYSASWVFHLGKVLWHFVSQAEADFLEEKKLSVQVELGRTWGFPVLMDSWKAQLWAFRHNRSIRSFSYCYSIHIAKGILHSTGIWRSSGKWMALLGLS